MTRHLLWSFVLVLVPLSLVACAAGDEPEAIGPKRSDAGVDTGASSTVDSGSSSADTGTKPSEDTSPPEDPPTDPPADDAGTPPPSDCPTCIMASCKAENDACTFDTGCTDRAACYTSCKTAASPASCRSKCDTDFPSTVADSYLGCVASKCKMCKF